MAKESRLQAALYLAGRGWRVFPLHWPTGEGKCSCGKGVGHPIGKHPLVDNWQDLATTDEDQIKKWWKRSPEANVGLATGEASGLIVLDIDGSEGEATVQARGHEPTVIVRTGKGRQLYFQHPGDKIRNRVGRFPQLDSRGDGGYVVAPGSLHHTGRIYSFDPAFHPDKTDLAKAPAWWLEACLEGAGGGGKAGEKPAGRVISGRRNATLASMAGVLRDKGLSVDAIKVCLLDYNRQWCDPPLEEDEVESIANSYGRYEAGDPNRKYKVSELTNLVKSERAFLTSPIDSGGCGVRLHVYMGGVFNPNGADVARRMADRILGNASRPDTINSVVDLIRERTKTAEELLNPKALELVNCSSGMLEWRTGKVHKHDPAYLSTFQIQAAWDPGARHELLDKFIEQVFPPDAVQLVEEIIGYLMVPSTKYQKAVMLVGEGANGKSTFLSMLCHFLQECNVSRMSLQQLEDSQFAAAELQGKLANVYADIPSQRLEKSDTFKSIVAGDPIKAERKFGHPFILRTVARLLFSANEFPRSADTSAAFFRRWIIIPFPNKFEGKSADPDLVKKLRAPEVMSALLARAVAGLRRLEDQQRFSTTSSVEAQVESYKVETNSAYEFCKEMLRVAGAKATPLPKVDLYDAYVKWCERAGVRHPVNTRRFNHTLVQAFNCQEVQHGAKRTKSWQGVEWQEKQETKEAKF